MAKNKRKPDASGPDGGMIVLPWPPSVNHYWRRVGFKTLISREGRSYRSEVAQMVNAQGVAAATGWMDVCILASPPDRRRRDLDNILKALLDSLEHAGVFADDGKISRLTIKRLAPTPPGHVLVSIAGEQKEPA